MNQDQRAAFEAWYMSDMFLCAPVDTIVFATDDNGYYLDSRVQAAWRGYQAALESPEVQALRKDAERLSFIESEGGADIVRLSGDEWEVSGIEEVYGTGHTLREAIDAAMEKQECED